MYGKPVDSRDDSVMGRLYEIAEAQGGLLASYQAVEAGIPRSTLSYHATAGRTLERLGHGVYRMRRFPSPAHAHVIAGWLALARADAVVSHVSALELLELTDLIADSVDVTLPRSKRGLRAPLGVRLHFTERSIAPQSQREVLGVPVTSVERTLVDVVRSSGWSEQIDLGINQAVRRGLTSPQRLKDALPIRWQSRLDAVLAQDAG